MKKVLITALVCLMTLAGTSQEKLITGRVFDQEGYAIPTAVVQQVNTSNYNSTDIYGAFHLFLAERTPRALRIDREGFVSVEIAQLDTVTAPLHIVMMTDGDYEISPPEFKGNGSAFFLKADFLFPDFQRYDHLLGDENIDLMNRAGGTFTLGLDLIFNKVAYGISFGFASAEDEIEDELSLEFNTSRYGIHVGYHLINSRRLMVEPRFTIQWDRFRLLNYDAEGRIPISNYLDQRDIDLRLNQTYAIAGVNLAYKIYNTGAFNSNFFTVGLYGGYLFKLNENPWLYSRRNRLSGAERIDFEDFMIGIFFTINSWY